MQHVQQYTAETIKKLRRTDHLSQYLLNLTQQHKGLQLYQLMSTQNKLIYIDVDKKYAIIQSKYIHQLQQQITKLLNKIQNIQKQIKQEHNHRVAFKKIIELKDIEIENLKKNIKEYHIKLQELDKNIKNNDDNYEKKQIQIRELYEKYENLFKQEHKNQNINDNQRKSHDKVQAEMQTQFDYKIYHQHQHQEIANDSQIQVQKQQNVVQNASQMSVTRYQEQIRKLKENFQKVLEEISTKTQNKLEELEKEKQLIKEWAEENRKLKQENAELKKQIRTINEQEQKIKIWKNTLENFVQNVEKDYQNVSYSYNLSPSVHQGQMQEENININNQNVDQSSMNYLKQEKMKMMQATIDRFQATQREKQSKLAQIKALLDTPDEGASVSEQNIVGYLLSLSSKVKQVIRYLLQEIFQNPDKK